MPKIKKNVNIEKAKYWAFVAYPDSLPENWRDILTATGIPCCVSPLHDADINADETQKKAHYHILLCYGNTTTYNTIKKITDSLNATIPQVVNNLKGYYRYLTHADNPEKAQYDKADILSLNGFCVGDYVELTKGEQLKLKREVLKFISQHNILEYCDLLDFLDGACEFELFDFASSHTILFNTYLKSKRHKT